MQPRPVSVAARQPAVNAGRVRADRGDRLAVRIVEHRGDARELVEHDQHAEGASVLHVVGNPHAVGFYHSCGFVAQERCEPRFGPATILRKQLAAEAVIPPSC